MRLLNLIYIIYLVLISLVYSLLLYVWVDDLKTYFNEIGQDFNYFKFIVGNWHIFLSILLAMLATIFIWNKNIYTSISILSFLAFHEIYRRIFLGEFGFIDAVALTISLSVISAPFVLKDLSNNRIKIIIHTALGLSFFFAVYFVKVLTQ